MDHDNHKALLNRTGLLKLQTSEIKRVGQQLNVTLIGTIHICGLALIQSKFQKKT
jgi:hypothetical protein